MVNQLEVRMISIGSNTEVIIFPMGRQSEVGMVLMGTKVMVLKESEIELLTVSIGSKTKLIMVSMGSQTKAGQSFDGSERLVVIISIGCLYESVMVSKRSEPQVIMIL